MNLEALVRLVVAEVLQALQEEEKRPGALVLFTGGKTGYQQALGQVKELEEKGWDLLIACSNGAEAMYGLELREFFPQGKFLTSPLNLSPIEVQKNLDLVLIPVLSQNSLAKIALGLADTLPTLLIKMALLLGKPIIASRNGGDARYFAQQKGLFHPNQSYLQMMDQHLEKLQSFGIRLVDIASLRQTAEQILAGETVSCPNPVLASRPTVSITRGIVTRDQIMSAFFQGQDILYSKGTLVTPLARDLAKQHGVKLVEKEKE